MTSLSLLDRLRIVSAAIDVLLNHPGLKFTEFLVGIMILRQTVLFGKVTDSLTLKQLSCGVPKLNRGTGCHPRRISLAIANLEKIEFLTRSAPAHAYQGTKLTLEIHSILDAAGAMRVAQRGTSIPERGPGGSLGEHTAVITAEEVDRVGLCLRELVGQLHVPLPDISRKTCETLLRDARKARPHATADQLVWFIRDKLISRPGRFESWGGVVHVVRQDFGKQKFAVQSNSNAKPHQTQKPEFRSTVSPEPIAVSGLESEGARSKRGSDPCLPGAEGKNGIRSDEKVLRDLLGERTNRDRSAGPESLG